MENVEAQVDAILGRKTFKSAELREKTRQALLKTLRPVAAIRSFDEEDAYADAPSEYRYDDSDGVACTTIDVLEQRQSDKKADLRRRSRELFSDDEQVPQSAGGTLVAEENDINRKLKWGYTALHFAALAGDEAECMRLIAAGADVMVGDNGGKLPWQKAEFKGHAALALKLMPFQS